MDRIEKLCAERGMRMTEQRRVIARVLSNADDHPDVEELYRRASSIDPHISIATVYRTVRLFEEARRYSSSTSGWSSALDSTRAMTRRCSVMRMPRSAQSFSIRSMPTG